MTKIEGLDFTWQVGEAKAEFSKVLQSATKQPQIIKNREEPVAAIISMTDYKLLLQEKKKWQSFVAFSRQLAASDDLTIPLPPRDLSPAQF